jgi:hypothetical protein
MRATITMPLETLKAIIERAREFEFIDDDEEFDETELEDDDAEEELDEDDEEGPPILVANDDESDEEEASEADDVDVDDDEEAFEDILVGLTSEELSEILALAWMGEGEHEAWDEAVGTARALSTDDVIVALAENPTLSEAIERGLIALGYEISDG